MDLECDAAACTQCCVSSCRTRKSEDDDASDEHGWKDSQCTLLHTPSFSTRTPRSACARLHQHQPHSLVSLIPGRPSLARLHGASAAQQQCIVTMRHRGSLACLCLALVALTAHGAPCVPVSCPIISGYAINRSQQPAPWWRLRWLGKAATVEQLGQECAQDDNCLAFTADGWLYHRVPYSYLITGNFVPGNWSWHTVTECDNKYKTSLAPLCGGTYITALEGDTALFQLANITSYLPDGDPGLPCPCIVNTTCGKFTCASFASSTYQSYYSKQKTPKFNGTVIKKVTKEAKCSTLC